MSKHAVVHDTIVVERRYPVAPAKVFAAWADVEQRRRWHFPGEGDWKLAEMTQQFEVGGEERFRFGPKGGPELMSVGRFLDIVHGERIVSAGTMHEDGVRISTTLCTVELAGNGKSTQLKLTDQSAFFDGREKPEERRNGWGQVLKRFENFLGL